MSIINTTNRNVSNFTIHEENPLPPKWRNNSGPQAAFPVPELFKANEGLVSDELRDAIFAVYTWMMPLNSALTIVFCVVNAAVYWQQRAATFALYLIGVDIGDGLCAVVKLCSNVAFFTISPRDFQRLLIDWYMGKYLALSFRRVAICLNLLASLERFLAIAFPLKNLSRRVLGRSLAILAAVFLLCLAAHSFMVFEYHVVMKEDGDWRLAPTDWKMANPYVFVVVGTFVSCAFAYAPLTAILVLNFLLLVMLRVHSSILKTVRKACGTKSEDRPSSGSFCQGETAPGTSTQHRYSPRSTSEGRNSQTCDENSDIRETNTTQNGQTGHRSLVDSDQGDPLSCDSSLSLADIEATGSQIIPTTNHGHHRHYHHDHHDHPHRHHQSVASNPGKQQRAASGHQRSDSPSSPTNPNTHHHHHHQHGLASDPAKQHSGWNQQRRTAPPPLSSSKSPSYGGKGSHSTDASVTRLVMVFTTVFFLLALPDMLSFSARVLLPEYGPEGREANLFQTVSLVASLVSHLTEPALFWVSFVHSRHFRRAVFRLPGARWCCGRCSVVTSFASLTSSSSPSSSSYCDVSNRRGKSTF